MGSRRTLVGIALAALLVLAAAVAGAGQAREGKSTAGRAPTTVTLAGWASSPEETAALRRTIASFERFNKDIKVSYTPISGDYDATMLARFAARRPPDVFYVDSLDVPDYLPALEPLNAYMRRTKGFTTKPFFKRLLAGFTVKGQVYGFPKDWSPLGMVTNRAMMQRAGIARTPQTWGQFTTALTRLRSTNAVPGGAPACLALDWARILAFMYQNDGAWINVARTQSVINSRANIATLNTYLGWLRSGLAKTPAQLGVGWCGEALGKEKAALSSRATGSTASCRQDFPNVGFAVQPMIRNKARGNLSFTVAYSMGKASRKKPAAWRLLRFLVGKNGQGVWIAQLRLPALARRRQGAGRPGAPSCEEAPYARPWQFVKGFARVNDLAGKELEKTAKATKRSQEMLRTIHVADSGRDPQSALARRIDAGAPPSLAARRGPA